LAERLILAASAAPAAKAGVVPATAPRHIGQTQAMTDFSRVRLNPGKGAESTEIPVPDGASTGGL